MHNSVTDINGIKVGHYTDVVGGTGCTVMLCPDGSIGGVDVRGAAPGTRETDMLRPGNLVPGPNAVVLSGGSAFGLDAASGAMKFLEENGIGYKAGKYVVPIVTSAILFDLDLITDARPGLEEGYMASVDARSKTMKQGSVGAGTGATVGKALGMGRAVKGGIGTASLQINDGPIVAALVAVNAMGDVVDPASGSIIAGPRIANGKGFDSTLQILAHGESIDQSNFKTGNTTIGVVVTNARLPKEAVNKMAQVAHDGLAMTVRPSHTMSDGDLFFSIATCEKTFTSNMNQICAATVLVVSQAIMNGISNATSLGGIPAVCDLET